MKRTTALRHLSELAAEAQRLTGFADMRPPLSDLWVGGELLDGADAVEWITVVGRLDVPADELPYLALHPQAEWCTHLLRLDKLPIVTEWRPSTEPAWNHKIPRVARFWSAQTGVDELLIKHLRDRSSTDRMVEQPSAEQLRSALEQELPRSEQHLATVLDNYWEPPWQRAHRGNGIHPDDHLWRAAEAVRSIREALAEQP